MRLARRPLQGLLLAASLALGAAPTLAATPPPPPAPRIARGIELVATRTVRLREATLRAGSRVMVVAVARRRGRPVAVDLELGDGHVLRKVAFALVRTNFRVTRR